MTDLDAIEARLALATQGPWRVKEQDPKQIHRGTVQVEENGRGIEVIAECYCGAYDGHGLRNADLIAHAPEDLAALIEEVRYLRGERAAVVKWLREPGEHPDPTRIITMRADEWAKRNDAYADFIESGGHRSEEEG